MIPRTRALVAAAAAKAAALAAVAPAASAVTARRLVTVAGRTTITASSTALVHVVPASPTGRRAGRGRTAIASLFAAGAGLATFAFTSDDSEMVVFSGNANPALANDIATLLGVKLGTATVSRFADGEVNVQVHDNVRGKDVYIIQPTCAPVNEHLMELLLMVSTMRRASAEKITVVMPYYGYARQDRKMASRVPISAADVARLLEAMGVDRVIALDLHSGQIQGFFPPRVPVDNLAGGVVGVRHFTALPDLKNPVIISPDAGGVYRAKQFREGINSQKPELDAGLAMIIKQRLKAGEIEKMDLVGNVTGSDCIIVDDMIDTAGTLCSAAEDLKKAGARKVYAFATHGLFSGPASDRIARSVLEAVVVTDTIPLKAAAKTNPKIVALSVAPLLAEAIKRVHLRQSVSELFTKAKKPNAAVSAPIPSGSITATGATGAAAAAPKKA